MRSDKTQNKRKELGDLLWDRPRHWLVPFERWGICSLEIKSREHFVHDWHSTRSAGLDRGVLCERQDIMKVKWTGNSDFSVSKLWPSAAVSAFTSGIDFGQPSFLSPKVCFSSGTSRWDTSQSSACWVLQGQAEQHRAAPCPLCSPFSVPQLCLHSWRPVRNNNMAKGQQ